MVNRWNAMYMHIHNIIHMLSMHSGCTCMLVVPYLGPISYMPMCYNVFNMKLHVVCS